jgi:hypothetical protein
MKFFDRSLFNEEDSMESDTNQPDEQNLEHSYQNLLTLWTSGIRDYHSLLSDYLTANSIFVAAIGILVTREPVSLIFHFLVLILCVFGILMTLQMGIVLGRFSLQNDLWEWQLRGIERKAQWSYRKIIDDLYRLKHREGTIKDKDNDPAIFHSNWALRQHRQWWAHRAISFPLFFGIIYGLFLLWDLFQLRLP